MTRMRPHCPTKFTANDIIRKIYVLWDNETLEGDIVITEDRERFLFFHKKTTPLKEIEGDMIFSTEYTVKRGYYRNIKKPYNAISKLIAKLFGSDKVFYQNNEIGDIIMNYLKWCSKN